MTSPSIPLSVLDLSFVREDETPGDALIASRELARHAERLGYERFWMAEHHNMEGIASAATAVALAFVAGDTRRIRIGSGGVMLPNHAPLIIAEQFGTLASLYPGRIDLGIGRAPGTDHKTARALRRNLGDTDTFPQDVQELQSYFEPAAPGQEVRAVPGEGLRVPVWLLGSSLYSAQLAAFLGLPFAFASHFAPEYLLQALQIYRKEFQPSPHLNAPYAMVAANVVVAESNEAAQYLFSTAQQGVLNLLRGRRGKMQPPVQNFEGGISAAEREGMERFLRYSFVGDAHRVEGGLRKFLRDTEADELIVTARVYDLSARIKSLELLACLKNTLQHPFGSAALA